MIHDRLWRFTITNEDWWSLIPCPASLQERRTFPHLWVHCRWLHMSKVQGCFLQIVKISLHLLLSLLWPRILKAYQAIYFLMTKDFEIITGNIRSYNIWVWKHSRQNTFIQLESGLINTYSRWLGLLNMHVNRYPPTPNRISTYAH